MNFIPLLLIPTYMKACISNPEAINFQSRATAMMAAYKTWSCLARHNNGAAALFRSQKKKTALPLAVPHTYEVQLRVRSISQLINICLNAFHSVCVCAVAIYKVRQKIHHLHQHRRRISWARCSTLSSNSLYIGASLVYFKRFIG